MSARLKQAFRRLEDAERSLTQVLLRDYPIGTAVHFRHSASGVRQRGVVLAVNAPSLRVQVRNRFTGREYWIAAERIAEAS